MEAEKRRLHEAWRREEHWRRWGPYLSERQWGTVREDYSEHGTAWEFFPFEHSHLRAYRWGEDGIAGICDNHQRLCFALAFWNGRDPILKERLFGLTGNQGNHGEDVKEYYYYLDSTPTHSYMKCLYKYPQAEFPYKRLLEANTSRSRQEPEYELLDTGIFDENRYFDVFAEYAKVDSNDILIRISVANRGPESARLHLLPTLWFRNTWSWDPQVQRPAVRRAADGTGHIGIDAQQEDLGSYRLMLDGNPSLLFTENETNAQALWGMENARPYVKDSFHQRIIKGRQDAVNPEQTGTKACAWYQLDLAPGETSMVRLRLTQATDLSPLVPIIAADFDGIFAKRIAEADEFYSFAPATLSEDGKRVQRQAFAGLLWSKQFYHSVVETWLKGDPGQPPPPASRLTGRNAQWVHLYNEDVISMPDKWEYPWYAAWDLAFHAIPLALVDPEFAMGQMQLFLREWYMHPNGQIPAYEWAFGDVNPPVHAWACWRVYQIHRKLTGRPDYPFLERVFHKLLLNFTWWVNRKDSTGNNIFEGGFLGLDNIGVFDRSKPLPWGGYLEQSDGTSWMAMFCLNMLKIALELATKVNQIYEDVASKFFEHFLYIAAAMNGLGDGGLWDETDGFFYDRLRLPNGQSIPMKVRSMVGLIPLFAVDTLEPQVIDQLPGFRRRMEWFMRNRPDLCGNIASLSREGMESRRLLSLLARSRLIRVLERMLSESEFLSPHGIRALSKYHQQQPFILPVDGQAYRVDYEPAESNTGLFGGNSNWRGPVWFPVNFLLIESLQRFNHYFGNEVQVEFPTGSGEKKTLGQVAEELSRRLSRVFLRDGEGRRPVYGGTEKFQADPHFRDHVLFYEYFHGDNGAGLGASHQTGWTALVAKLLQQSGE
ncbi:MAG: glucosidase [Acidobacteriia bacterium]|nr:glucosidase [Terriglobia bacterium]